MQSGFHPKRYDPFWILFFFFMFILGGGLFLLFTRKSPIIKISQPQTKQIVVTETPRGQIKKKGYLLLKTEDERNRGVMGQDMKVSVIADSNGVPISGFDVVLIYDPTAFIIKSAQSVISDFRIFSHNKAGEYTVSGIPSTPETPPHIFSGSPIVTYVVEPMSRGESHLSIQHSEGSKADSNLFDATSTDVLASAEGITVSFGDEVKLTTGSARELKGTGISLILKKVTLPSETCRDCTSQVDISLTKGEKTVEMFLQLGGFGGKTSDEASMFGYTFSLVDIQVGEATLVATQE